MKQTLPLKRNDDIELSVSALGSEGQGVGRYEGLAVFVPRTLPEEIIKTHIVKTTSSYAVGKLTEVVKKSHIRVEPICPVFDKCGGCTLQHFNYEEQLVFKRKQVLEALQRIGGFDDVKVENVIGMEEPMHYRNKGSFPCARVNGRAEFGFFAPHSHRLIPINDCAIQNDLIIDVARAVRDWANENNIEPYNEETGSGILRHIVARTSSRGEVMAIIVTTGALPHSNELIEMLSNRVPLIKSVIHNINSAKSNVIFGKEFNTIWGDDYIIEKQAGLFFQVSAASFLQVNPIQTEELYNTAMEYLALSGEERVVDGYSGIGTISLRIASKAKEVIGIENVKEAVEDARRNAKLNAITNVDFVCDDAEHALPKLVAAGLRPDSMLIDPPRKGCELDVLRAIIICGVKRLVYISCNPSTLARDARILADGGFEIKKVQPVDMFPMGGHVETCVLLSHKNS